jgi:DNA (cytosine-5)-methyltransferase 1
MNVLSLFDGIGCGRIALDRIGVEVENYFASEIEPLSTKVLDFNYPKTKHLGDVTKWKDWNIDFSKIDLLLAGFPCQSWSLAGKQKGLNDERGQLVYSMTGILKHIKSLNPNIIFLFENVKMKPEYLDLLNEEIGVYPLRINSKLLSTGLRDRYYWTNIKGVEQPKDLDLKLTDILESGKTDREKSLCITKRYEGFSGSQSYLRRRYFGKSMGQAIFEDCEPTDQREMWKLDNRKEYPENQGEIRSLTTLECERIQTLPEGYVSNVLGDNMKAKGIIGNGWTVDVIAHIFKNIPQS